MLIVGAGVSGIGAAYYRQRDHPQRSYAIVEARAASGGTWDLFRYPGVRSDSDLHTFGYEFRPWRSSVAIADAPSILSYLRETAAEYGIDSRIRYRTRVVSAAWSSDDARWTVETEHTGTGERSVLTCRWLLCAAGYYRYDQGYAPDFAGRERSRGPVIHPQHWPGDLDYAGQRVVIIGSGATAVTLVPAMADTAAQVTVVQRTPSYVIPLPAQDKLNANTRMLPPGYPVDEHFNPPYDPWDQRLCLAADADLFRALRSGKASVVTGAVSEFTGGNSRLQGHAAVRGARLQRYLRLRERVLDAAGRPARPVPEPAAQLHGRPRLRHRAASRPRPRDGDPPAAQPHLRVHRACLRGAAPAGHRRAVAHRPGLQRRRPRAPPAARQRPRAAVLVQPGRGPGLTVRGFEN